ncbi:MULTISPECIES: transcriptional regulator [Stenotrophomonas]|uniref:transcriptional regulator n=1 Tax=Stenotrophomonas sp. PS02300 TaxID=2991426 RepID=UPI00249B280E|nr:transcriptional regulator [Stenotrophomonas sp. PS02300]
MADALFTQTQQRILGLIFGQSNRDFAVSELITATGGGSGAVQRELAKLTAAGLLTIRRSGNQKRYQANPDAPIYHELVSMIRKTVGLAGPLMDALLPIADDILVAFVYGSIAKQSDTARSDIDLMIVSDTVGYADVMQHLETSHQALGRPINPTIYSRHEWNARIHEENSFLMRVLAQPKIWVIGGEHELNAAQPGGAR